MRVRGGNTQQNLFLRRRLQHDRASRPSTSRSASIEVSTAGYGADGAIAPGGLVSMVTKAGSNKYELDVNGFHEDSLLRPFTDDERRGAPRLAHVHQPELLGADHQGQALVLRQRRGPRRALLARRRPQRLFPAAPDPALLELPGHHQAHLADVARGTSSSTSPSGAGTSRATATPTSTPTTTPSASASGRPSTSGSPGSRWCATTCSSRARSASACARRASRPSRA